MNKKDLSERDICTKFITPALVRAGWDLHGQVREELGDPLRWGTPKMIFVNSMSDLFYKGVPDDYCLGGLGRASSKGMMCFAYTCHSGYHKESALGRSICRR